MILTSHAHELIMDTLAQGPLYRDSSRAKSIGIARSLELQPYTIMLLGGWYVEESRLDERQASLNQPFKIS